MLAADFDVSFFSLLHLSLGELKRCGPIVCCIKQIFTSLSAFVRLFVQ